MAIVNPVQILSAMECPVCYDTFHPPIYLCENGHGVCGDCHKKLNSTSQSLFPKCPVCRVKFQTTPSSLMEMIYERLHISCKYSSQGCPVVCYGYQMKNHMEECDFKPRRCPRRDQNCSWKGPRTMLTKHYVENHL